MAMAPGARGSSAALSRVGNKSSIAEANRHIQMMMEELSAQRVETAKYRDALAVSEGQLAKLWSERGQQDGRIQVLLHQLQQAELVIYELKRQALQSRGGGEGGVAGGGGGARRGAPKARRRDGEDDDPEGVARPPAAAGGGTPLRTPSRGEGEPSTSGPDEREGGVPRVGTVTPPLPPPQRLADASAVYKSHVAVGGGQGSVYTFLVPLVLESDSTEGLLTVSPEDGLRFETCPGGELLGIVELRSIRSWSVSENAISLEVGSVRLGSDRRSALRRFDSSPMGAWVTLVTPESAAIAAALQATIDLKLIELGGGVRAHEVYSPKLMRDYPGKLAPATRRAKFDKQDAAQAASCALM